MLVGMLYRRLRPAGTAAFALLLFAIDDAHWMPIVWSAARNGPVSMVPSLLGLGAHLRWREQRLTARCRRRPPRLRDPLSCA
jgi:hypothetical protein